MGKVLLAHGPHDIEILGGRSAKVAKHTDHTVTAKARLIKELQFARF